MTTTATTAISARSSRRSPWSGGLDLPPGGTIVAGVRFEAIPVYESPERLPGDEVSIVYFTLGGVRLASLGDLGHALKPTEAAEIRRVDVALIPAGGPPTLAYHLMAGLLEAIEPGLVVPMHCLTPRINLKIQPVERFFEALPDWPVHSVAGSTFEVDHEPITGKRRIVRLQPGR